MVPPGIYHLTAKGANSVRPLVESDPVAIDIERPDDPIKLKTELDLLDFEAVGDQLPITALGTFSDGNTLDITYSSRTTYISNNPNVATVSGEGIATAVGLGETQILIRVVPASTKKSVPAFSIPVRVHKPKANDSSTARPNSCSANSGKANHASQ